MINIMAGNIRTVGVNQYLSNDEASLVSARKVVRSMSGRIEFHQASVNPTVLVLGEINNV